MSENGSRFQKFGRRQQHRRAVRVDSCLRPTGLQDRSLELAAGVRIPEMAESVEPANNETELYVAVAAMHRIANASRQNGGLAESA